MEGSAERQRARERAALRRAVPSLIVTQIIGWGTIFHVPAVLYASIADGTGISRPLVFGGMTAMLLVAAALSSPVGRVLERDGARRWMMAGSLTTAAGISVLSAAHGPALFFLAWVLFGAAMPLALNQASSTALVQLSPSRARNAIALLLLVSGFSATVSWPTLIWLADRIGWRETLLTCAALHLALCLPLHAWSLPGRRDAAFDKGELAPVTDAIPPPRDVPGAYALAAISFALGGMLTWGLPLHMVGILVGFGHDDRSAVAIGSLFGPGQVLSRGFEMAGGRRFDILTIGVGAAILMPLALGILLLWGDGSWGAIAFSLCYGLSAGFISIVRAVAPLRLFGSAAYARVLGRLNVPQNIAFAATPFGFAVILELWGARALVVFSLALALACLVATAMLERRVRAAERMLPVTPLGR